MRTRTHRQPALAVELLQARRRECTSQKCCSSCGADKSLLQALGPTLPSVACVRVYARSLLPSATRRQPSPPTNRDVTRAHLMLALCRRCRPWQVVQTCAQDAGWPFEEGGEGRSVLVSVCRILDPASARAYCCECSCPDHHTPGSCNFSPPRVAPRVGSSGGHRFGGRWRLGITQGALGCLRCPTFTFSRHC